MYTFIITGGRNNNDVEKINAVIHGCYRASVAFGVNAVFYVGDCRKGVDKIAADAIINHKMIPVVFRANWRRFRRAAGPLRNRKMIDTAINNAEPNDEIILVAFAGGAGTADCISYAESKGIRILKY